MQETQIQSLVWGNPLEKGMVTCSSVLAWRSPWTEEPGGLQSMGSQRVGHNLVTNTFTYFSQYYLQAQCGRKLQDLFLLNVKLCTLEEHLANAPSAPGNHHFTASTCWTITDPSYKQNYAVYLFCDGLMSLSKMN